MTNLADADDSRQIATAHFGLVEVREQDFLSFHPGLPPFDDCHLYVLLREEEEEPFLWLQSVEQPALALVVAPCHSVLGEPAPELPQATREQLGLAENEQPEVYLIISLGQTPPETTINLLAPLYVCPRTGRARQVILEGEIELTRVPLLQEAEVV
jgi:flagellar assembly factor FliW